MKRSLECFALCAVFALGCAGDFDEDGLATDDDETASSEEVGTVQQGVYVDPDIACPDPGQTIFYTHARIRGQDVGGSISNGGCVDPEGCITSYHICAGGVCQPRVHFPWPGDSYCLNS